MILSMGTCIQFHDENLPILLLYTMKIKEITHIILSLIVYHILPTRILE